MPDEPTLHNLAAERAVIGSCLLGKLGIVETARVTLGADSFYDVRHNRIWRGILSLAAEGTAPDPVLLPGRMKEIGEPWHEPADSLYLHDLYNAAPMVHTAAHVDEVARWAHVRRAHEMGVRITARASQVARGGATVDDLDWLIASVLADVGEVEPTAIGDPTHQRAVAEAMARLRAQDDARRSLLAESRPAMPQLWRLDELLSRPIEPVKYLVDGLWPNGGRVILAAQAKTGKTTLRDNLVRSLVDGSPFLDKYSIGRFDGTVALVDTELSEDTMARWLRDQHVINEQLVYGVGLRGQLTAFDLLDPDRLGEWATALAANRTRVLIVDCIGPVLASFGLDESKGLDVGRWLNALDALAQRAGVGEVLVVHHMGHNGERSRGASRLRDWPDAEWRLLRNRDGDLEETAVDAPPDTKRYFAAVGRDVDEPEAQINFDAVDRRLWIALGERITRAKARAGADVPAFVDYVREHEGMIRKELADAFLNEGIQRKRFDAARAVALKQGLVHVHDGRTKGGTSQVHYAGSSCVRCPAKPDTIL